MDSVRNHPAGASPPGQQQRGDEAASFLARPTSKQTSGPKAVFTPNVKPRHSQGSLGPFETHLRPKNCCSPQVPRSHFLRCSKRNDDHKAYIKGATPMNLTCLVLSWLKPSYMRQTAKAFRAWGQIPIASASRSVKAKPIQPERGHCCNSKFFDHLVLDLD